MKIPFGLTSALSALGFASSAFASGPLVVQASASISNLQINVSDFRPEDSIVAKATLISSGNGRVYTQCCDSYIDYSFPILSPRTEWQRLEFQEDALINAAPKGVTLQSIGSGSAQRTSDGLRVDMAIDKTHFESVHIHHSRWSAATVYGEATASIDSFQLELAPGTQLELSGMTAVNAFVDMTQQSEQGDYQTAVLTEVHAETYMNVNPANGQTGIEFLAQPLGPEALAGGDIFQVKYSGRILSIDPTQLQESKSFTYVIRNNGLQSQTLQIGFGAKVWAEADHGGASLIPEPSSWAMLLSGVGLMGVFARRRQAA